VTSPPERTQTLEPDKSGAGSLRPTSQLFLVVRADAPLEESSRHSLENIDEVTIGRGEAKICRETVDDKRQLVITLPDEFMSSSHAHLKVGVASCVLSDLGSKNGTLVNGKTVATRELEDGDLVEVGQALLLYRSNMQTPASAAADASSGNLASAPTGLHTLIPALASLFADLSRAASSLAPVLISGPTGSGKELLARSVHQVSKRTGSFVAVNCGAIPTELVESELFGHVAGAFSGASSDRKGLFEAAHKGTLFLDEIGELPQRAQVALLRVLQEREVVRVGSTEPIAIDTRVVAATHRDLLEDLKQGRFREDLYSRLCGFRVDLPALRDRLPDFGLILASVLRSLGKQAGEVHFTAAAARTLLQHPWPRNIRELYKQLEVALALAPGGEIEVQHLRLTEPAPELSADAEERRTELLALVKIHKGNVTRVAQTMGKKRQQVQKWLKRFAIDPADYR
jgi:DNA-binding NtrC family response regulator